MAIKETGYPVPADFWIANSVAPNESERHLANVLRTWWPAMVVNPRNPLLYCLFFLYREVLLVLVALEAVFRPSLPISQSFILQPVGCSCRPNASFFACFEVAQGRSEEGFFLFVDPFAYSPHLSRLEVVGVGLVASPQNSCGVGAFYDFGRLPGDGRLHRYTRYGETKSTVAMAARHLRITSLLRNPLLGGRGNRPPAATSIHLVLRVIACPSVFARSRCRIRSKAS